MTSKTVRIGFTGCGEVARLHAKALKKIKQAEISAVSDINVKRAQAFAKRFGIKKYYRTQSEMLQREDLDAVYILTNPQTHTELAIEAMNHGKHVLVEKPLCCYLNEAEEMVKVAEKNNVILFPIEQFIFSPAIQRAIKIISSGAIGKIYSVYGYMSVYPLVKRLEKGELPQWFYDLPGGIYGEEISHVLYTSLKILNEHVREVQASCIGRGNLKVLPCEELRILLESENKSARLIMTSRSKSRFTLLTLIINGERGVVIVEPPLLLTLIHDHFSSRLKQLLSLANSFLSNTFSNIAAVITRKIYQGCSWEAVSRAFIRSILDIEKPLITKEEGKEWVRVTELVWEKAKLT